MSRFCDGYTFVPGKYGKLISFFKIARFFSETIGLSPLFWVMLMDLLSLNCSLCLCI